MQYMYICVYACRLLSKDEQALEVYMDAIEVCPENPELLTTVGLLHLKLGTHVFMCLVVCLY